MNQPSEPKTKYKPFGSNGPPAEPAAPPAPGGHDQPWFGPQDLYLFNEGSHLRLYEKFGAHPTTQGGVPGFHFYSLNKARGVSSVFENLQLQTLATAG